MTEEISIPYDFHRFIIGQQGKEVRRMMREYDVNISIPSSEANSEIVTVYGPPANTRRAIVALNDKCEVLEREKADKVNKNKFK